MVDAYLPQPFLLFFQPHPLNLIFWEKTYAFNSSDITQAQAGRRKGSGGCQWRTGPLLMVGVVWGLVISVPPEDAILKKTVPHDWRFSHRRHRPAAGVPVACHGITLHIGIGEFTHCGYDRRDCCWVGGVRFAVSCFHQDLYFSSTVLNDSLFHFLFVKVYGVFSCWICRIAGSIPREVYFLVLPCAQDTLIRTQLEESAEGSPWWLLLDQFHIMIWWWKTNSEKGAILCTVNFL